MSPPPAAFPIRRLFWGWERPVLDFAIEHLTKIAANATGPSIAALDLSDTLIIVPTSESARRLREGLAIATERTGSGVTMPWVWTPEQALAPPLPQPGSRTATPLESLLAWHAALQRVPLESLTALFPTLPDERGWSWYAGMARLMDDLNSLLGAGGLRFAEIATQVPADGTRWNDLAAIERAYLDLLAASELADPQAAKSSTAKSPILPEAIRRLIVLAAPDLPPLFDTWLRECAQLGLDIAVAVQAPLALAGTFDDLGRPLVTAWGDDADHCIPISNTAIRVCHGATHQAATALDLLREMLPLRRTALGVADPEVAAMLEEKLTLEQAQVFEPGGVPVQDVGLWHVLVTVRNLLSGGSWRAFASLLRIPDIRRALTQNAESGLEVLAVADDLAASHLPMTLVHARELLDRMAELRQARLPDEPAHSPAMAALATALEETLALLDAMKRQPLSQSARTLLVRLFGDREFAPDSPRDQLTTALASAWLRIAADLENCSARFRLAPAPDEAFSLSLELLAQERLTEPRGEVDLILQGWLELLWEASPGLIITGLNEEHVPGILVSHTFLPDRLRRQLGLPCLATRFARDAYLLRAIAEQRVKNGRLELLFGQWSERGDSLRPSRLLFLCPDAELPSRVTHLFPKEDPVARDPEPPRTLAWKLSAQFVRPAVNTISPSRIRSYLECAFRDYLSNELHMEPVEPRKRELAPNEFGSLAHHAFQCLAADPSVSLSTDPREIEEFLVESALQRGRRLYGARWAPLVGLQIESLKQRLRHAAQCEAEQRELGWRILKAEWQLGGPDDEHPLLIEGARLRCTIDRIERHEKTGEIRVLDFKTADKAGDPRSEHTDKITARKRLLPEDEWKCFDHSSGVRLRWKDLQLPLYAAALRLRGISPQSVGYFAIPKSVQETRLKTWEDFNDEWVDAALACAAEVVRRLREGLFWPPATRARDREFDSLFLGEINATVEISPSPREVENRGAMEIDSKRLPAGREEQVNGPG